MRGLVYRPDIMAVAPSPARDGKNQAMRWSFAEVGLRLDEEVPIQHPFGRIALAWRAAGGSDRGRAWRLTDVIEHALDGSRVHDSRFRSLPISLKDHVDASSFYDAPALH